MNKTAAGRQEGQKDHGGGGEIPEKIRELVGEAVSEVISGDIDVETVGLEHPANENFGDYSTNVALTIGSKTGKNPRELAVQVVERLRENKGFTDLAGKIEVEGPGFINIWLKNSLLVTHMMQVLRVSDGYGRNRNRVGKKVMVEFTDPNPFKEFHIGHVYSNAVGESLSRILEFQGAEVWRVNYHGDVGLHVAKALWGLMREFGINKDSLRQWEEKDLGERIKLMGRAYAGGAKAYEEQAQAKSEIDELNRKVYAKENEIWPIYETGKRWSLEYFDTLYKYLGTVFKKFYFESEAGEVGLEVVEEGVKKGIFVKSDGATVFGGEKYGLHTRVFVSAMGLPTYEAKELGLAMTKQRDFAYDESVIVTGNEIDEYFKVLLKAMELLRPELARKTRHISHGMVRLPEGKMSSRTGKVLTAEWMIEKAKEKIWQIMEKSDNEDAARGLVVDKARSLQETVLQVAVGAIKYALLKSGVGKDIEFNFDESLSFEGNSGPYLQYTFARTESVIRKAGRSVAENSLGQVAGYQLNEDETRVLRWIYRFPEAVGEAGRTWSPNGVGSFLFELAGRFNAFYNKHSILKAEDAATVDFRLAMTAAVGQVIKNGLWLLGISAPARM